MKHKNIQPLYIFNRENLQNSKAQNGPRRGLDYIALVRPEDKRRLSQNEFQGIAILRQSLPNFQGIVLLTIEENKDGKLKFQNQCKYKQGDKCEKNLK